MLTEQELEKLYPTLLKRHAKPKIQMEWLIDYIENPTRLSPVRKKLVERSIELYPEIKRRYEELQAYCKADPLPLPFLKKESAENVVSERWRRFLDLVIPTPLPAMALAASHQQDSQTFADELITLKIYHTLDDETALKVIKIHAGLQAENRAFTVSIHTVHQTYNSPGIEPPYSQDIIISDQLIPLTEIKAIKFSP